MLYPFEPSVQRTASKTLCWMHTLPLQTKGDEAPASVSVVSSGDGEPFSICLVMWGFPGGSDGEESVCNAGDLGSIPGLERSPWRREKLPTPVFLPGEFHTQRSLAG